MAKIYIYSTLANDQKYTNWIKGGGDVPVEGYSVLVKGGTGVANDRFVTPLGVATEINDIDLEELRKNPVFNQHEKDGFVYAGPIFPNNFQELADLQKGRFYIVDTNSSNPLKRIDLKLKDVVFVEFEITDALKATDMILSDLEKPNVI